jgi:hypothetical protein
MECITLQEAIWKKLNCTSTKKTTRAYTKLFTLSLCDIMENKWNKFAEENTMSTKKMEINLYFIKKPEKEVTAIPLDQATMFVDKYIIRAHKKYVDNMNKGFDEIFARNPDMKRLSDEEIEQIKNEPSSSEHESDDSVDSEAESDDHV